MAAQKTFMPLEIKSLDDEDLTMVNGGYAGSLMTCPSCSDLNITMVRVDGELKYKCQRCGNIW